MSRHGKPMWKQAAYEEAQRDVIAIEDEGHEVLRLTDWHWRIDGKVDVWPSSKKYMVLAEHRVRKYSRLTELFK